MSGYELKTACLQAHKKIFVRIAQLLCNAFIDRQFIFAPLIWMFFHKTLYQKMQTLGAYNYSPAKCLLLSSAKMQFISFHHLYQQFLLTEIYKSTVSINPRFMWHFFRERQVLYNPRKGAVFFLPPTRSTTCGINCTFSWCTNSGHPGNYC